MKMRNKRPKEPLPSTRDPFLFLRGLVLPFWLLWIEPIWGHWLGCECQRDFLMCAHESWREPWGTTMMMVMVHNYPVNLISRRVIDQVRQKWLKLSERKTGEAALRSLREAIDWEAAPAAGGSWEGWSDRGCQARASGGERWGQERGKKDVVLAIWTRKGRALVILHIFVHQICANICKLQMCKGDEGMEW